MPVSQTGLTRPDRRAQAILAVQMVLLLGCSISAMRSMAAAAIVYTNDFQGTIGAEWSNTSTDTTPAAARRFLGQFSNQTVSLTLNSLPAHAEVTLEFDLFVIRSWDGSDLGAGPDVFEVSLAGGSTLLAHHLQYAQRRYTGLSRHLPGGSHPSNTGALETYTLGYLDVGSPSDAVYHLSFTLPHTASSVAFNFAVSGLAPISNESWGLDNVVVSLPNACDNRIPESPEQCDEGSANGTSGSCCNTDCTWRSAGTICRTAAGECDVAERCTGSSAACPGDAFKPATTVCRASAGACDSVESCTGSSATCPPDSKSTAVCRAAAGQCDVAERCDGFANNCPPDVKRTQGRRSLRQLPRHLQSRAERRRWRPYGGPV
jgi:hypothetical protein